MHLDALSKSGAGSDLNSDYSYFVVLFFVFFLFGVGDLGAPVDVFCSLSSSSDLPLLLLSLQPPQRAPRLPSGPPKSNGSQTTKTKLKAF